MKAISTRFYGQTNTRGSRIVASDIDRNRVTLPYDYSLTAEESHAKAAAALRDKMKWTGELVGGAVSGGYVWVFTDGKRI